MAKTFIGIDLGGTKILGARVNQAEVFAREYLYLPKDNGDENVVINLIIDVISKLMDETVQGIGIGLPSIVDSEEGIVYDVQNIPSWKEVHLIKHLEKHFNVPIYMNNDANCYALGEAYFGQGIECEFFVGLTIGTGLGAGIIYNQKLIDGSSGASGEFGILPYQGKTLEDYCSGQFFENEYKKSGYVMAQLAEQGDEEALKAFREFGFHLGNAIKIIMSTVDPQRITIGGSVAQSRKYYEAQMNETIKSFPYGRSVENIQIAFSDTNNMGMLGAASLCFKSGIINV